MSARLLFTVAHLVLLTVLVQANDPPTSEEVGPPAPAAALPREKEKQTICRMEMVTCVKKVPYTVARTLPNGKVVYETCYKEVPETVLKPVYESVDPGQESKAEEPPVQAEE